MPDKPNQQPIEKSDAEGDCGKNGSGETAAVVSDTVHVPQQEAPRKDIGLVGSEVRAQVQVMIAKKENSPPNFGITEVLGISGIAALLLVLAEKILKLKTRHDFPDADTLRKIAYEQHGTVGSEQD